MEPRGDPLLDGLQRPGPEPEDGRVSTVQYRVQYSTVPKDGGVYLGLVGDEGGVDPGPVHRARAPRGGGHQVQHQQDLAL